MIKLTTVYAKKVGLPNFSSHQFSISLETELADVNQLQQESARLYSLLQTGVDTSIKEVGFLPGQNGDGHNGHNGNGSNGNGHNREEWLCSPKQKELILKLVEDSKTDKRQIEALAVERFGVGVKLLNRLQASGFIEELLERYGDSNPGSNRSRYPQKARA